ncbi:RDD family protein [Streptosporangium sp. NPDC001559]|uniref:RDD family protein n=1 Tax=Streptosporangium sp. NPDC001559 TaxID=3366187 RepID=UPI0036E5196C
MNSRQQPRWTQTWLGGVRSAGVDLGYPGERLGLPQEGSGSVAGFGRRIGALVIDWLICTWAITQGLLRIDPTHQSWVPVAVLAAEYLLLAGTMGMTFGMRLTGIRIAALNGGRAPFPSIVVRTVLLCLAVPALIWDRDQRGLHDRAAATVVVRM